MTQDHHRLSPTAAILRGFDYQHAIAWLWICRMLSSPDQIASVTVEDPTGGAFNDVVVRRHRGGPDLYIQAKSSNYGDVKIDQDWLLGSKGPEGKSPLQHFYNTFRDLSTRSDMSRVLLELQTVRGFDSQNPLLGELRDQKHSRIDTLRMLKAGPRSKIGRERDKWARHLEISLQELAGLLTVMRWKQAGSETDIREQIQDSMKSAGLRSDKSAVLLGIGLVREWVTDGGYTLDVETTGRRVAEMQLPRPRSKPHSITSDEPISGLPPACAAHIRTLQQSSPEVAQDLLQMLEHPASLVPGVLAQQIDDPPEWLKNAEYLAWEAIAEFLNSHNLPGVSTSRREAIRLGSPRSDLYRLLEAKASADEGNNDHADFLLKEAGSSHPLYGAICAAVAGNSPKIREAVLASQAREHEDPDVALNAILLLARAQDDLGRTNEALKVLEKASDRFPDRATLYWLRAALSVDLFEQKQPKGAAPSSLLESAVELALEARNRFRNWKGPSAGPVEIATAALLKLGKPERVCDLTALSPEGEATQQEAEAAAVIKNRAHALLTLNRYSELDKLDWDLLDESDSCLIKALQARGRDDPDALELMRKAVGVASDDQLLMALHCLALLGEVDEAGLERLTETDDEQKLLIRASASYHREDYDHVVELLARQFHKSDMHAELLANAKFHLGATDEAIDILDEAVERHGITPLRMHAVDLLKQCGRLQEAEELALKALAEPLPPSNRRLLLRELIEFAERRRDWPAMERYAQKLLDEYPEEQSALWAIVDSHLFRGDMPTAWKTIVEHSAKPFNKATAKTYIAVYQSTETHPLAVGTMLDIASDYADDELIAGCAINTLLLKSDSAKMTEVEQCRFDDLLNNFFGRFSESHVLRRFDVRSVEDLVETMKSLTAQPSIEQIQILSLVRFGQAPYGILRRLRTSPYAELLVRMAAGHLTTISVSDEEREREHDAVRKALGGEVAADTSVAAIAVLADLPIDALTERFKRVLIADDLLTDARRATASTSHPVSDIAINDPVTSQFRFRNVEEHQSRSCENIARLTDILQRWRSVPSGSLKARWDDETRDTADLHPWDASLRVALDRQCALWCDDIALRRWAQSEGIPAFGTYALWEVLTSANDTSTSLQMEYLKGKLLHAGIADVPLTWDEITAIANDDASGQVAFNFLARPASWYQLPKTLEWYLGRAERAVTSTDADRTIRLLQAALFGAGNSVEPRQRRYLLGHLLADAVLRARDLDTVPNLVLASRYACWGIDPSGGLDVLCDATAVLLNLHIAELVPPQAVRTVVNFFSKCEQQDRNTVASAVLLAHAEPQQSVLPAPPDYCAARSASRTPRTKTTTPRLTDARRAADALRGIGARQVLLFGSVARGLANADSDIDLVAVFDDLGDYSQRHSLEMQAQKAVEDASGWSCDILITDRVEWSVRSKLATTIEAEIARSSRILLDLPVEQPIDWNKRIQRPASDKQEMIAELRAAARHMRLISQYSQRICDERKAPNLRDGPQLELARYDRMRTLCESSHSAASAALRALLKGVLRKRPSRDQGHGRFVAMLNDMPQEERSKLEATLRVSASTIDAWEQRPGTLLPSEVLESVTPELAADMAETARSCCELAASSIDTIHGSLPEARDLLKTVTATDTKNAISKVRKEPAIAKIAYELNGLNPPNCHSNPLWSRGLRSPSQRPTVTASSRQR